MNSNDSVWIEYRSRTSEVEEQRVFMLYQEERQINLFPESVGKNPEPDDPAFQPVFFPDLFGGNYNYSWFFVNQRFTYLIRETLYTCHLLGKEATIDKNWFTQLRDLFYHFFLFQKNGEGVAIRI